MFTIIAKHHDPTNTEILDASGQLLYSVATGTGKVTTVTKADGALVGTIHFPAAGANIITIAGQDPVPEYQFLQGPPVWGTRVFEAPDGKQYKWHTHYHLGASLLALTFEDADESDKLLTFHPKEYHILHKDEPGHFEIEEVLRPVLDIVILTWVVVEQRRQHNDGTNNIVAT